MFQFETLLDTPDFKFGRVTRVSTPFPGSGDWVLEVRHGRNENLRKEALGRRWE